MMEDDEKQIRKMMKMEIRRCGITNNLRIYTRNGRSKRRKEG